MNLPSALTTLVQIHAAFPFLEGPAGSFPRSFRVHLAAMLNQYCAAFFPAGINRMAFAYSANTPRSGKSLLAKMGIIAVHGWPQGQTIPMSSGKGSTPRVDETELRKILDATIATGIPYLFFDNVRGHIESQALEAFLTLPVWSGRVFGRNDRMFSAENLTTLVVTGNDLNLGPDLKNRFLNCDLFVAEAEASERKIANPIEDKWIFDNRQTIIDCMAALVAHWDAQGRPGTTGAVRPGFETWCHIIGGILMAAGVGDVLAPPVTEASGSVEEQHAQGLARHLASFLTLDEPERRYQTADLANICHRNGWFHWTLDGKEEEQQIKDPAGEVIETIPAIKLSPKGKNSFGHLIKKYAPTHIDPVTQKPAGRTWRLRPGVIVRLHSEGQDHKKRIIARLETSDRGRIEWMMNATAITLAEVEDQIALSAFTNQTLDTMTPDDLRELGRLWPLVSASILANRRSAAEA